MRLSLLSLAVRSSLAASTIGLLSTAAMAEESNTTDAATETLLDEIVVTASADASKTGLPPAYQGGQVATGSRIGMLGNQSTMETPFSTTAYTNDFILNKQADSVGDILKKDSTVRVARGFGNFQEAYLIRGFVTNSDDTMMNGLYGIMPRQFIASELFERVEVQRGASTFLNGMAPGGSNKGGTVNLLPKRATQTPIRKVTISSENAENGKIALDVGQRFGANQAYGVRANVAYQDGGTAVDDEKAKLGLVGLGLDYRQDNMRLSADLGYQNNELQKTRTNVTLSGLTRVPKAADAKSNWSQPWSYSNEKDVFGTLRAEYDLSPNLTAYGAYGFRHGEEENSLANLTVTNLNGDGTTYRFDNAREDDINTGEIGIRGKLTSGKINHNWVVSGNIYKAQTKAPYQFDWQNTLTTNLYHPTSYAKPSWSAAALAGGDIDHPTKTGETTLTSVALADTLAFMDDKLQVTLGARHQTIEDESFDPTTQASNGKYKESKTTPAFALLYRPSNEWSVFANYMQSLSKGETAPLTTTIDGVTTELTNAGQAMSPYVTKQSEIGVKYDRGVIGAGLTAFQTNKPRYTTVDTTFEAHGKNQHKGVELNVYGQPTTNMRVLGGVTFLDTQQKDTGSDATEGKQVIGAAKHLLNLGLEYDLPQLDGLTLTGDVIHTGKRYANEANTLTVDGYTTVDLGARYKTQLAGKAVTLKGVIANVTDKDYWSSVGGYENTAGDNGAGYLTLGEPRTLKLSATFDF